MPQAGAGDRPPAPRTFSGATNVATKTTKERAHEALAAAGLSAKPPRSNGSRRLVLIAVVILVVLVIVVAGSLAALDHLQTTVNPLPSTTSTTAVTTTTQPPTTTTVPTGVGGGPSPSALHAYVASSADGMVLRQVGSGGQALGLVRTAAPTFITDAGRDPVLVYWWDGGSSASAAENLVVVSALAALGGTFHGLRATSVVGPLATIDLRHATYHGPVVLEASEVVGANGQPAQAPTDQATSQFRLYDARPYTKDPGAHPFLDVAGRYVLVGVGYTPALLAGRSLSEIAAGLTTPDTPLTRAILGNANQLVASVCTTLAALSRPLPIVCSNPAILAIEPTLPTTAPRGAR